MLPLLIRCVVLVVVAVVVAAAGWYYGPSFLSHKEGEQTHSPTGQSEKSPLDMARREGSDRLIIPADVARRMGLETGYASEPKRPRRLSPFQGCLAIPPEALARARSRFSGEVMQLGKALPGVKVEEGEVLAVVWSKDLGEKKSELADALSKLELDQATLRGLRELLRENATSERSVREAERAVAADRIAIEKAERTLRAWRLTDKEIEAIRKEAKAPSEGRKNWASVEVRAPRAGVVVEMNVNRYDIIDTSTDLYKIADLSSLSFWAHVYEEDLPLLSSLPKPAKCKVTLPSLPGTTIESTLKRVSPVIDSNQHTALVTGLVPNPNGDLKSGQFVTVSVELPPQPGEIELPAEAVVEDGETSMVFVPVGDATYKRVRVAVSRRFHDAIFVKATPDGVQPQQRVVTRGALLLKAALDHLPSSEGG
jgi:cobalt-zinc-cadmium efflux system membrane fusion protein